MTLLGQNAVENMPFGGPRSHHYFVPYPGPTLTCMGSTCHLMDHVALYVFVAWMHAQIFPLGEGGINIEIICV